MISNRLPTEFDPVRYAAAYPDVGLSGLSAKEHYLRFGRRLGRDPAGKTAISGETPSNPEETVTETEIPTERRQPEPIIARPEALDLAALAPPTAPPRPGRPGDGRLSLEALALGPFASPQAERASRSSIAAYAQLFSLAAPAACTAVDPISSGESAFETGAACVENAWYADASTLRLAIAGGTEQSAASDLVIRGYQAKPRDPTALEMTGNGVQLPSAGPLFHDLRLHHPLMPLFLELSDREGVTKELILVAFPSFLPGGVHAAELRAVQDDANPMRAFWSLTRALVAQHIGHGKASITGLSVDEKLDDGKDLLSNEVRDWLEALFAMKVDAGSENLAKGLTLHLPAHGIPTIGALVSRSLDSGGVKQRSGPFLVVERSGLRPRWSVTPADFPPGLAEGLPILKRSGRPGRSENPPNAVSVHLAIVGRSPDRGSVRPKENRADTANFTPRPLPATVVIEASDAERVRTFLGGLRKFHDHDSLELIVRMPCGRDDLRPAVNEVWGENRWIEMSTEDLRQVARTARNAKLVTISDRIRLAGSEALPALCAMIDRDGNVGSASCLLLTEAIVKKQAVVRPGSGGLFPDRVSFAVSPRLGFAEPDVSEALADMTYPVIANTFHCTAWRTSALAALPGEHGYSPPDAGDIRLGLDLIDAGFRNLCTTKLSVLHEGPYVRRDVIDPVGATYLQPGRWEDVLGRVTILRELF